MYRTFSVFTFIASLFLGIGVTPAQAHQASCEPWLALPAGRAFTPAAVAKTALSERNGWTLQWHKTARGERQLLAIQKTNMLIRRIQPLTGKVIAEKQYLNANAKMTGPATVHSTGNGELIVAVTRANEGAVDIYSDAESREFRISAYLSEVIKSIQVVSLPTGDLFLLAATHKGVSVFKRVQNRMDLVANMKSEAGVRQMFAFQGRDNDLEIAFLGLDHKVHLFNYDTELESLEEKQGFIVLGGQLQANSINGRIMFIHTEHTRSGTSARIFSVGGANAFSRNFNFEPMIGEALWAHDGSFVMLPLKLADKSVIRKLEPTSGKVLGEDIVIGGARSVSDLSRFMIGAKEFFVFTQDFTIGYIFNENEPVLLPAPEKSAVKQMTAAVQMPTGEPVLAVLGVGPNGSVVNVLNLTAGSKAVSIAPTATAD